MLDKEQIMTVVKEIISPIADLIKDPDDGLDSINMWEASLPSRGPEGCIALEFDETDLIIILKEFKETIKTEPYMDIYDEHMKTVNLSDPDSMGVIRKVIEDIKNGFSPEDGIDGWEFT